jgi:sensor histidine kinase YesM
MIPVEDEVNTLQLYMELEQLRFENKFDFRIEVDDDIDTEYTYIPPMLIQPFIENSIIHGIGGKEGKGNIKVELEKQNGIMLCTVEDDGIGRERSMQKKQDSQKKKHKSLGMQVTKERLDILNEKYGNNISFTFYDKKTGTDEPSGTRVEIRIPFEEE